MFKIAIKDLKLIGKDKRALVLTLVLPIALISLFAYAFVGIGGLNDAHPISIFISDMDSTNTSRDIIASLDTLKSLYIKQLPFKEAKDEVVKGSRVAVLVFYKGFGDSVENGNTPAMELFYDQSRQIESGILRQILYSNLIGMIGKKTIKKNINKMIDESYPDLSKSMLESIHQRVNEQIDQSEGSDKNPINNSLGLKTTPVFAKQEDNNLGLVQSVAGTAIMMLLFTVTGIGAGMLHEKEEGTLKKLLCSPSQANTILFGKMIATIVVSVLQLTVMFIFTWIVFGLDILIDVPSLILMILTTAFACAGFGIFIASIAKSRKQVESYSTLIILVMSAIVGSMIPIFIMPAIMQKIAILSVNYWSIQGFYDIYWRHLPILDVSVRAAVLLGIGLLMIIISVRNFKRNILSIA